MRVGLESEHYAFTDSAAALRKSVKIANLFLSNGRFVQRLTQSLRFFRLQSIPTSKT